MRKTSGRSNGSPNHIVLNNILLAVTIFGLSCAMAGAEDKTPNEVRELPPSMEIRKVMGVGIVAPSDAKFYKKDGISLLEGAEEYSTRKLAELDKRFNALQAQYVELKKEVAEIKKNLEELKCR